MTFPNAYSGGTTINQGTLNVTGTLAAAAATYSAPLGPAAIKVAMVTEAPICSPAAEYAS